MNRYRYLSERPLADQATTERLMDFESVLSETFRKKRFLLVRNTVLVITLVLVTLLSVLYFSDFSDNKDNKLKSDPGPASDTLTRIDPGLKNPGPLYADSPASEKGNKTGTGLDNETSKPEKSEIKASEFSEKETFTNTDHYRKAEPLMGFDSLYVYFKRNLIYPEALLNEKVEGNVVIKFVITKEGRVGAVDVLQSLHPVLDSIAVASIRHMPPWRPASMNGEPVDSKHSIPLVFNVESQLDDREQ